MLKTKRILVLIIGLLFVARGSFAQQPQDSQAGKEIPWDKLVILPSVHLPSPDSMLVFTPAGMDTGKTYPLLILLHGWSGNYSTWNSMIDCQRISDSLQLIIVCPDGFYDSWYLNHPLRKDLQYADFFKNDFLPYMTMNYPLSKQVFITGQSMGGHGALYLASMLPDAFTAAGAMSGVFNLSRETLVNRGLPDVDGSRELWKVYSIHTILKEKCLPALPVYLDCGMKDTYLTDTQYMGMLSGLCRLDFQIEIFGGTHNRAFWQESVYRHIDFMIHIVR